MIQATGVYPLCLVSAILDLMMMMMVVMMMMMMMTILIKMTMMLTQATGVYPLWLVPAILDETGEDDPMFVDLGVYGWCHRYAWIIHDGCYLQSRLQKYNPKSTMVSETEEFGRQLGNFVVIKK